MWYLLAIGVLLGGFLLLVSSFFERTHTSYYESLPLDKPKLTQYFLTQKSKESSLIAIINYLQSMMYYIDHFDEKGGLIIFRKAKWGFAVDYPYQVVVSKKNDNFTQVALGIHPSGFPIIVSKASVGLLLANFKAAVYAAKEE